ncbi:efflux RND transporter periplasmic adaptor subunit [Clostridium sp. MCC353]|uniref:efflux RND transporter periplasmic adaptor subunit n=1 Tax=Clostridium sp. MCC353 TaxID=2592646 RepID=UPI001C0191FD|nr:efflux RND transporter periplasmic adaptor subunit [Clostridium sp. MCC353]MBT9779830.1 efflux RND transporter periplasmic adaptor subunit [Clostridium sp. MCC353]
MEEIKKTDEFDQELERLMEPGTSEKKRKKTRKKWSRRRKIVTGAAAAAVVVLIAVNSMNKGPAVQAMVNVTPLVRGDVEEQLMVNGPVEGTDSVDVVSNLHAEIIEMPVKEGDQVKEGQLLAVLDRTDIQKEVDIAQNAYDLAVANYNEQQILAENGYAKAVQALKDARDHYTRSAALFQSGGISQVDLDNARTAVEECERQIRTYNLKDGKPAADDSYALQIKNAEFELDRKKKNLEDTEIKSPIDGTVVRVNTKVGRFADTTEDDKPIFIIENLEDLEMKINISEYSIGKVEIGQPVTISADILNGETVQGQVIKISPTGEEKGGGSTERVIPTTVKIEDNNSRLIAGITAKAQILINESKDTWLVPVTALIQKEDGDYIAAVNNGIIQMIPVETGVESDIQIEVIPKEGAALEENMTIVTNPNGSFEDGMAVAVMAG